MYNSGAGAYFACCMGRFRRYAKNWTCDIPTYDYRAGLVVMGFVADVVMGYSPVLTEDVQQGAGGIATLSPTSVYSGIPKSHTEIR